MKAQCLGLALAAALVAGSTAAQPAKVASAAAPADVVEPAPGSDRDIAFEGRVLDWLLSPDARVAGLLFEDGRQVNLPPDAGRRVVDVIRPGVRVRVEARRAEGMGSPAAAWPALTALDSGRRVAPDQPEPGPGPRPDPRDTNLSATHVGGTIDRPLHGPRGEINGVRLNDGVQIFFPPHIALEHGPLLGKGMRLDVQGFGRRSEFGTAVQATEIGIGTGTGTGSGQIIRVYQRP